MATTESQPAAPGRRPRDPAVSGRRSDDELEFRPSKKRPKYFVHLGLIAFGALMLYPLAWLLSSSFKPTTEIFREPGLVPKHLTLENYPAGWTALAHDFGHYMLNSLVVVTGAIAGN